MTPRLPAPIDVDWSQEPPTLRVERVAEIVGRTPREVKRLMALGRFPEYCFVGLERWRKEKIEQEWRKRRAGR